MNAQILIKTTNDWFEFTKSKTGQLDYVGKWEKNDKPRVDDAQEFISSTYFSPAWYVFIQGELNCNPTVYVAPDVDVSDKDLFDYLVHIGLCAERSLCCRKFQQYRKVLLLWASS